VNTSFLNARVLYVRNEHNTVTYGFQNGLLKKNKSFIWAILYVHILRETSSEVIAGKKKKNWKK